MDACPLCGSSQVRFFLVDKKRDYFCCQDCDLRFADALHFLYGEAEKAIYDCHINDPDDQRYQAFLNRLVAPLSAKLAPQSVGLDYGCGPGPTVSQMLAQAGHQVALYDPFYYPNKDVLTKQYDFVTCTEVVEHFYQPARDWPKLFALLKPHGWLAVMTQLASNDAQFQRWYYKGDPTHVSFYSQTTMNWIAAQFNCHIAFYDADVMLFQRRE
ncbi:class I SAM-dependent methyltransferase [Motilimonas eburnea]|uniref:class I SAM-dependent methyltransferase n=1 Tax=Motilimonas eburnea TaxID=1737488 RepID=UPI001E561280|nr:class I SAM-dependent methyltransferase [Motilimonas eburnea]MCE2571047.1 class I SAM-dependent methyltransferase [Motilimonas eburnea]